MKIPFNKPTLLGNEIINLKKVIRNRKFSFPGEFSRKCSAFLKEKFQSEAVFMTSSCSGALELSALICNLRSGDEVIVPSFTYVSTVLAFAEKNIKIIWCDIKENTKNIDETQIEKLISPRTKAIIAVHYAGVSCEIESIRTICDKHNLFLIEDAAHSLGSTYRKKPLGSFGDLAVISFHETKNIQCGEGGALIVNNKKLLKKADYIFNLGTNRTEFNRKSVEKWTWHFVGKNYKMSELNAAFLYAQLKKINEINSERKRKWNLYYQYLSEFLSADKLPFIPENNVHNAHIFYLITESPEQRKNLIQFLHNKKIQAVFHYQPLHLAPFWNGKYREIRLPITEKISETILRLPLFYGIKDEEIKYISESIKEFFGKQNKKLNLRKR